MNAKDSTSKEALWVFLIPLLIKLPLLVISFGVEEDAWGHVLNGKEMVESQAYIISRLPGHPLLEALSFILWQFAGNTYWIWNLPFALSASWAGLEFFRILNHFRIERSFWLAIAFSLVPIILFSGATVMDYAFQLALTLSAYRLFLRERFIMAALLIGLAIGFRLTSALFLLPMAFDMWREKRKLQEIVLTSIIAVILGLAFYLPAYNDLGIAFFNTYSLPYPPIAKVIYKGTVGAFGVIGFFALIIFGIKALKNRKTSTPNFWWIAIGLHLLLFLRLPEKSAFLIPLTPFLLLAIAQQLEGRQIQQLSLLLIVSPFILGVNLSHPLRGSDTSIFSVSRPVSGQEISIDLLYGPYDANLTKRKNKKQYVEGVLGCDSSPLKGPVIAGWWYAMLEVMQESNSIDGPDFHYYLPPEEIDKAIDSGLRIFAMPEQASINARKYGYDESTVAVIDYPCP